MAVWLLLAFFTRKTSQGSQRILVRIFLVAMFLRFAVPLTLIANDAIYDLFLEKRYNESTALVSTAGKDIEHIGQSDAADLAGAFEGLGATAMELDGTIADSDAS